MSHHGDIYKKYPTSGVPVYVYMVKLISLVGVSMKYHLLGVGKYSVHLCSKQTECATSNAHGLKTWDKCSANCAGNNFACSQYHSYFHCDQIVLQCYTCIHDHNNI